MMRAVIRPVLVAIVEMDGDERNDRRGGVPSSTETSAGGASEAQRIVVIASL